MSTFKNLCIWIFWGPMRKTFGILPPEIMQHAEKFFAFLFYVIFPLRRKILKNELIISYGRVWTKSRITKAVKKSFRVHLAAKFRLFHLPRLTPGCPCKP